MSMFNARKSVNVSSNVAVDDGDPRRIRFETRPARDHNGQLIVSKKTGVQLFYVWMGVKGGALSAKERSAAVEFLTTKVGANRRNFGGHDELGENGRRWYFVGDSWDKPRDDELQFVCQGLRAAIEAASALQRTIFGGVPLQEMPAKQPEGPKAEQKSLAITW